MAPALLNLALRMQPNTAACRLGNGRNSIRAPRVGVSVHAAPMLIGLGALQRQRVLCMSSGKETNAEQQTNGAGNVREFYCFHM